MKRVERSGADVRINVLGEIGRDVRAATLLQELSACGDAGRITVYVDSCGGSVWDGLSIYTSLARHPAYKVTEVIGIAASIASIIAMAGDEIHMASDSFLMLHNPFSNVTGDASELKKRANLLEKTEDRMITIYTRRSGLDPEKVRQMMAGETWRMPARRPHLVYKRQSSDQRSLRRLRT